MIHHNQWLLWTYRNGAKRPLDRWGNASASTRREDFISFEQAKEAEAKLFVQGIAFCFTADDPFVGIDLDNCVCDLSISNWASEILCHFHGTHVEFSPSLTGVKVFCRGKLPNHVRHRAEVKDGSIEIYDSGRFFTYTGMSVFESVGDDFEPRVTDQQAGIDWLIETFFRIEKAEELKQTPVTRAVTSLGNSLESRAADYVDHCDRPFPGGRNDAAFRLSGHLFAMEHDGELLTDSAVRSHVAAWNRSLPVPLPESEINSVVASAAKSGTPRDPKPKQEATIPQLMTGVDLSFLENGRPKSKPRNDDEKLRFPSELVDAPGFIGRVCQYTLETSIRRQPQLALGGALSLLSVLTGRKIEDDYAEGTRTNVYVLALAPSGAGKERPRQVNAKILQAAGKSQAIGECAFASAAGLTTSVTVEPAKLFQIDEFSRYLATMGEARNPHLYGIITRLNEFYTSSHGLWTGAAYSDGRSTQIDQPHCVLFATSTPSDLWDSIDTKNLTDGLAGRLMLFEAKMAPRQKDIRRGEIPEEIVSEARWWADYEPGDGNLAMTPYVVEYTEEAAQRRDEHLEAIDVSGLQEDEVPQAIWMRGGEKSAKLALLFACSRQRPPRDALDPPLRVELEDINRGIKLANWTTRTLLKKCGDFVSENRTEKNLKRVLDVIKQAGEISKGELLKKTRWCASHERKDILQHLSESGEIEAFSLDTGGRPRTILRACT